MAAILSRGRWVEWQNIAPNLNSLICIAICIRLTKWSKSYSIVIRNSDDYFWLQFYSSQNFMQYSNQDIHKLQWTRVYPFKLQTMFIALYSTVWVYKISSFYGPWFYILIILKNSSRLSLILKSDFVWLNIIYVEALRIFTIKVNHKASFQFMSDHITCVSIMLDSKPVPV